MKRVSWTDRTAGDIFLAAVPSDLGSAIRDAELAMHPDAPTDFVPSHAGIVGFCDQVIEAWMDLRGENSVAAINPADKYLGYEHYLELWRPAGFNRDALVAYVAKYGPEKYGLLNLLGFQWIAFVRALTGKVIENPFECSDVCSQGALIELGQFQAPRIAPLETWAITAATDDYELRDCDPLMLRLLFLANQT